MRRILPIVLLLTLLLSACGLRFVHSDSSGSESVEQGQTTEAESVEETASEETSDTEVLIETPYVTLRYPNRYEEYLVLERGDNDSVEFWGRIGAIEELVFIVYFDDAGEYQVGSLKVDGALVPVSIHFGELDVEESAGKTNAEIFWTMAEDANYLAKAIREEPNYEVPS